MLRKVGLLWSSLAVATTISKHRTPGTAARHTPAIGNTYHRESFEGQRAGKRLILSAKLRHCFKYLMYSAG